VFGILSEGLGSPPVSGRELDAYSEGFKVFRSERGLEKGGSEALCLNEVIYRHQKTGERYLWVPSADDSDEGEGERDMKRRKRRAGCSPRSLSAARSGRRGRRG